MAACLIAGDSIAVGVAPYLPRCAVNAKVGITSTAIIRRVGAANLLIISAGSKSTADQQSQKHPRKGDGPSHLDTTD